MTDAVANPIGCTTDLSAAGLNIGYLTIPHSVHRSAYGQIPMPVASCVGSTDGPRVLLMAGNHGDEYEGQIILSDLIRTMEPGRTQGQITILPMANFPAASAGLRTSPLDEGNLNRSFPGEPRGTPTQMIAHYIEHRLMPGMDIVIDLHSGGSSLYCVPFGISAWEDGNSRNDVRRAVMDAFNLDAALFHPPDGDGWYSSSAALRAGAAGITLELGGGGGVDATIRRRAQDGLMRALRAVGVYDAERSDGADFQEGLPLVFHDESLIFAEEPGVYEPFHRAGDTVCAGDVAALVHFPETPGKPPMTVTAPRSGYVLAHRVPARVVRGDCLFHLAHD